MYFFCYNYLLQTAWASSLSYYVFFQAQINKALGDASVVVKFSCATVCLLYCLTFIDSTVYAALAVTPG